jgi:hypothetical protein
VLWEVSRREGKLLVIQVEIEMLEIEPLLEMVRLTLQTGYVKNTEAPVNLLLIAKPEHAKTSAMAAFKIKGTYTTNNITQAVIISKILPMIENEGLKHLIIPDLLNAIEKDYTTRKGFLNLIKTLMEEGVTSLDTFNMRTHKVYNPPIKCGLITGTTSESYRGYYDKSENRWKGGVKYEWKRIGLLSRFVPFSYEYELSKIHKIFKFIENEEQQKTPMPKQSIKRRKVDVKGNPKLFSQLEILSFKLGQEAGGYGIRMQRNLQVLVKANAILNGRNEVTQEDIDRILKLGNWINDRFNPL